jgi:uncharacterized protein YggE
MKSKLRFCLCGLLLGVSSTFAADIPDYPFVFVVGKADIDSAPNIATCSLSVRAIDSDSSKAESVVDDRLKIVLATLGTKRISSNDVEASRIDKEIMLDENRHSGPASIRGYDVSRHLKFSARQLDVLPSIELSLMGSPNIENVSCQFDRADRADIEAALVTKAIHSARDQADKLVEPLGRHVTAAVAVSKVPFDSMARLLGIGGESLPPGFDRMFKKSVSGDELLVPSTISMSATVNVLFKIE